MRICYDEVAELLGAHREALPYRERAYGPEWLTWELISTPPARAHLVDWMATAPPPPWEPMDIGDVKAALLDTYFGDVFILVELQKALARIPRPVAEYALKTVTFIGIGAHLHGTCGSPPESADRPWLIRVSAPRWRDPGFSFEELAFLCAHEIAHCWTMPQPEPGVRCMPYASETVIYSKPLAEIEKINPAAIPMARKLRARYADRERVAEVLTAQWGFPGPEKEQH